MLPTTVLTKTITFFKKLFTEDRSFAPRKCFRYINFYLHRRDEKNHNFLARYQQGSNRPVENKPIERRYLDENLQRFCINFFPAWRSL